jgi:hypothetical protein
VLRTLPCSGTLPPAQRRCASPPRRPPPPLPPSIPPPAADERNGPTYKHALATASSSGAPGGTAANPQVYVDSKAPVYIVEGCAGDKENHEPFTRAQPAYSAFRSNTYGYSRMTVYNATHMLWEQVQTDNGQPKTTGSVIDAMLLVQHNHGPFHASV